MKYDSYKGVQDFVPQKKKVREYIESKWQKAAERYGYLPYDASILEKSELYTDKTSTEIVDEQTYSFLDRGERAVTLRPEMTPTLARMVAKLKQEKKFYAPLRWYSIVNLFRYESPQKGRTREHWQLNADIFGVNGIEAEKEILTILKNVFDEFDLGNDIEIHINDKRSIIDLFEKYGISSTERASLQKLIDKKDKLPKEEWEKLMANSVSHGEQIIKDLADLKESSDLQELSTSLPFPVIFNPHLIRGFNYYTGIIFEVFAKNSDINRSLAGGGRWDLSDLVEGSEINAVGFGLGNATLIELLEEKKKAPELSDLNKKYIYVTADSKTTLEKHDNFLNKLREETPVAIDWTFNKDRMLRKAEFDGVGYLLTLDDMKLIDIKTSERIAINDVSDILNLL